MVVLVQEIPADGGERDDDYADHNRGPVAASATACRLRVRSGLLALGCPASPPRVGGRPLGPSVSRHGGDGGHQDRAAQRGGLFPQPADENSGGEFA